MWKMESIYPSQMKSIKPSKQLYLMYQNVTKNEAKWEKKSIFQNFFHKE